MWGHFGNKPNINAEINHLDSCWITTTLIPDAGRTHSLTSTNYAVPYRRLPDQLNFIWNIVLGWFFTLANPAPSKMPSPLLSGIASLILPGLGQLLNGKYVRGGGLMLGWLVFSTIVMIASIGLVFIVHIIFIVLTGIDAYRIAKSTPSGL